MSTEERDAVSRRTFLRGATAAAAATAAAGEAAAQEGTETGGGGGGGNATETGGGGGNATETGGGGGGGGPTKEVTVGPGGNLTFEPSEVEITPGTTVHWVWESDNHNIVVESQPDGANWQGTEGSDTKTYDTGHEYEHTFDTEGDYAYFCQPHKGAGMTGTVTVSQDAGGGGGGGGPPQVPDSARTLGIAALIGMASTLGLAFFFLKYGGDYRAEE